MKSFRFPFLEKQKKPKRFHLRYGKQPLFTLILSQKKKPELEALLKGRKAM